MFLWIFSLTGFPWLTYNFPADVQKKQWGSCQSWGCRPAGQGAGTRGGTCRRSSFPAQRTSASHPWIGHKGSGDLEGRESRKGIARRLNMSGWMNLSVRRNQQAIWFTSATALWFCLCDSSTSTYRHTHTWHRVWMHTSVLTKAWWRTKPFCTLTHNTSAHKAVSVCERRSIIRPQNAIKTHTAIK